MKERLEGLAPPGFQPGFHEHEDGENDHQSDDYSRVEGRLFRKTPGVVVEENRRDEKDYGGDSVMVLEHVRFPREHERDNLSVREISERPDSF